MEEVQVKIISRETIKPLSPTSSNLKTYTLSLIDQIMLIRHVPMLLFYPNTNNQAPNTIICDLKRSLSQALSQFYPLAGRCKDNYTVNCNDEGVAFVEAHVNCTLSTVLSSPYKLDFLAKFQPPQDLDAPQSRPISEVVPLSFQINVFLCGGIVIGCYFLHKLIDVASLGTFIKYWSSLTSKRYDSLVQPDFDAAFLALPPCPTLEEKSVLKLFNRRQQQPEANVVAKSFIFNKVAICELRARGSSNIVPNPTRFEAVTGFLWEQMLAAASMTGVIPLGQHTSPTVLGIVVNMRRRASPPLPKVAMGNIVTTAFTGAEKGSCHPELVKVINVTLTKVGEEFGKIQGEERVENLFAELKNMPLCSDPGAYGVSSWCKLGLEEADFGFGKPVWIVPIVGNRNPATINSIFLVDHNDPSGDGIEAWLRLEEKEMHILESNPEFLAYASPN